MSTNPGSLKYSIHNNLIPKEGPKTVPMRLDFTAAQAIEVDLSQQNELTQISFVQTLYIDNSDNGSSLTVIIQGTQQRIKIAPGEQIYVPVLAGLPNKFTFGTVGAVIVPVYFINVPMPLAQWGNGGDYPFLFDGQGNLLVAEPNLDALIQDHGVGLGLDVNVLGGGGGGGASGFQLAHVQFNDAGASGIDIITTAANQFYRISGLAVYLGQNARSQSSPGLYEWSLYQGNTGVEVVRLAAGDHYIASVVPIMRAGNRGNSMLMWEAPPLFKYESTIVGDNLRFKTSFGGGNIGTNWHVYVAYELFT